MSLNINVAGGTGAGKKRLKENPPWKCKCPQEHPGRRYSCSRCGTRRADAQLQ